MSRVAINKGHTEHYTRIIGRGRGLSFSSCKHLCQGWRQPWSILLGQHPLMRTACRLGSVCCSRAFCLFWWWTSTTVNGKSCGWCWLRLMPWIGPNSMMINPDKKGWGASLQVGWFAPVHVKTCCNNFIPLLRSVHAPTQHRTATFITPIETRNVHC